MFPSLIDWLDFSRTNYFYSGSYMVLTLWGWMTIIETDGLSLAMTTGIAIRDREKKGRSPSWAEAVLKTSLGRPRIKLIVI